MKTVFIYALKELKPGEYFSTKIRYIGKAKDPYKRYEKHVYTNPEDKSHRSNWIRSLAAQGLSLQVEVLDEVLESEWEFWEKEYIRVFRSIGFDLVNTTDGGEGVVGHTLTAGHLQRMSAAMSGEKNPMFGKPGTMLGKTFSPEHRARIGAGHKGKTITPKARLKMCVAKLGKKSYKNTSGFYGVSWCKKSNKWKSGFGIPGKTIYVGAFTEIEDAILAQSLAMEAAFAR